MKLKTRTNQPVYYKLPVSSNIEQLSDNLLNSLRVGDVVQKKTGNQKHCYIVTYKEEKHGICLSYFDGSGYMETISYDYIGGHWVYNSKDVKETLGKNEDIQVNGITSKGIANTGNIANIGDIVATGAISGKTLSQSEPNKEFDIVINQDLQGCTESETSFKKCKVINNILYFIVETTLTNNTGANVSFNNLAFKCVVDNEVASKIYRIDGKPLNNYTSGDKTVISNDQANRDSSIVSLAVRSYEANAIQPFIPGFTLNDGASVNVSFRFFYSLI